MSKWASKADQVISGRYLKRTMWVIVEVMVVVAGGWDYWDGVESG